MHDFFRYAHAYRVYRPDKLYREGYTTVATLILKGLATCGGSTKNGGWGGGRLLPMTAYFPIGRYMKDVPFPPKKVI